MTGANRYICHMLLSQRSGSGWTATLGFSKFCRGLGLGYVKQLLHTSHNDKVVAACRNPSSATALRELEAAHTHRLLLVALDQNDDSSVKADPTLCCISGNDIQDPYMPYKIRIHKPFVIQAAMDKVEHERFGKIDYLINNAGIMGEPDLVWPIEQDGRPAECAYTSIDA